MLKRCHGCLYIVLMVLLAGSVGKTFAQTNEQAKKEPHIGLTALIQDPQLDVLLPIFVSPKFVFAPAFKFVSVSDGNTDWAIGAIFKFYMNRRAVSPYFLFRFGGLFLNPSDEDAETTTDYLWGIGFGGDYFLTSHFSLGVEGQVNVTNSDDKSFRFGNPGGTNVNTASVVSATVYF